MHTTLFVASDLPFYQCNTAYTRKSLIFSQTMAPFLSLARPFFFYQVGALLPFSARPESLCPTWYWYFIHNGIDPYA